VAEETSGRPPARWRVEPETQDLRRLQTAMSDAELALGRRMNLGPSDLAAMTHLASARQPVGPGWLSARLGLTPAAATELVDRLERVGHVSRERDPNDRRRVNLIPTGSSLSQVHGQLLPLLDAIDAVAGEFSADERAAIRRFLAEVISIYEEFAAGNGDP
jgi:DNA-binding MarR family transcriptional regulator